MFNAIGNELSQLSSAVFDRALVSSLVYKYLSTIEQKALCYAVTLPPDSDLAVLRHP